MEKNQTFDLAGYLLGEIYGPIYDEGQRIHWTLQDSIDLANDLALYGIDADPQEILELMLTFDQQDAEAKADEQL